MEAATPFWADRMSRDRKARGWSQRQAVTQLAALASFATPDLDSLLRNWKRWESGATRPAPEYQVLIARLFSSVPDAYFPDPARTQQFIHPDLSDDETVELVQQLRSSSLDDSALDRLKITVDRLCTEYSTANTDVLRAEARVWLADVDQALGGRPSYSQHGELLRQAGWLTLLISCLDWDSNDGAAARAARHSAVLLGRDIDDPQILGWAAEIQAWMALTEGDLPGAVHAATAGLDVTRAHSVSVQLLAQQAKAWSRMGNREEAEQALRDGRDLLTRLPYPGNPRNHFTVDPTKYDFYAMDVYRQLHMDDLAMAAAETVRRLSVAPGGRQTAPMRVAEAELTEATILARLGDINGATTTGAHALEADRRSLPSLLNVSGELVDELRKTDPTQRRSSDFIDRLHDLKGQTEES